MRANESKLRNSIARAEAAAKARAEKEARDAQAVRDKQQEASRKGTTYKPTESERSLMSRTGGLGASRSGLLACSRLYSASLWRTAAG
jgi:septal ring factor EnvC (AmiA/AmiB activator)